MISKTTDALSRLRYLRHRSSARCPYLIINEIGQPVLAEVADPVPAVGGAQVVPDGRSGLARTAVP
jgi:hypothetical protein